MKLWCISFHHINTYTNRICFIFSNRYIIFFLRSGVLVYFLRIRLKQIPTDKYKACMRQCHNTNYTQNKKGCVLRNFWMAHSTTMCRGYEQRCWEIGEIFEEWSITTSLQDWVPFPQKLRSQTKIKCIIILKWEISRSSRVSRTSY
jgi:hypothetical protein